tara:strand:+ start:2302 stop:3315 length:1014 start_codon:yes stop_codon:yes gene_type:complete
MIDINPTTGFPNMYNFINDRFLNMAQTHGSKNTINGGSLVALILFTIIIVSYYILFSYLGVGGGNSETTIPSSGIKFIEILMWGMFIFLVLINGVQYFLNIDIKASIKNIFNPVPELDFKITKNSNGKTKDNDNSSADDGTDADSDNEDENNKKSSDLYDIKKNQDTNEENSDYDYDLSNIDGREEVFHINDNKYNYEDAKAVCKAYGGSIATYKQVEDAYENGAEWCGFGWSDNQMALYPTQQKTWDNLQKIEGHEHDCGRPGVNGGYIDNKNVKFGVNCFGYKSDSTPEEQDYMDNVSPIPLTKKEQEFENKVDHYKNNLKTITRSPFNYNNWNE